MLVFIWLFKTVKNVYILQGKNCIINALILYHSTGNQSTLDKQFLTFAKGKKTNKANAKKMSLSK